MNEKKHWRELKPKTMKNYKSSCYLLPKYKKYPVCDKFTKKIHCKGLLAAHNRAALSIRRNLEPKLYSYKEIVNKSRKLAKKNKCKWSQTGGKTKKRQFLYNPDDPKKSFDVYIDKDPSDTIHMKYTTLDDVKHTIRKLERLYKAQKYPHKRIWQVGMILKVRLEAMKKHKKSLYPGAKNVSQRFSLANKYFKFLGKRSKKKTFEERKAMIFKV
tara:strand:- start:190 stop:831 length:642 start_codon:yes stop_codon:yes gene_type:complete